MFLQIELFVITHCTSDGFALAGKEDLGADSVQKKGMPWRLRVTALFDGAVYSSAGGGLSSPWLVVVEVACRLANWILCISVSVGKGGLLA